MQLRITTNRLYKYTAQPISYILKCDNFYINNIDNVIYIDSVIYELNVICEIQVKINGLFHTIYYNGNCKLYSSNIDKYNNKILKRYNKYNINKFYNMFN